MPKSPEGPRPAILIPEKLYRDKNGGVSLTRSDKPGVISPIPDNSNPHEHLEKIIDHSIRARIVRMGAGVHRILHHETSQTPQSKQETEADPV